MIAKYLMKKPILIIGILFMVIFLFQLKKNGYLGRSEKLMATSCQATIIMLNKRKPKEWSTSCNQNILTITHEIQLPAKIVKKGIGQVRKILYREIANGLMFISQNSPKDSLERTSVVRFTIESEKLEVGAVSEGKYLVKLADMKSPKFIAEHLKLTVKTKELIK